MIDLVLSPLLQAQAAVTALVGTGIYPEEVPMNASLPAITYCIVGLRSSPTLQTAGLSRYRVQFDCWASTALAAVNVRNALVAALNGFVGAVNGVQIQNMQVLGPVDHFSHELLQYVRSVEFYIWTVS